MVVGVLGPHDLGGSDALLGAAVPLSDDAPLAEWELDIDAVLNLMVEDRPADSPDTWPGGVHAFRKRIESLETSTYAALSYYERWTVAVAQLCLEHGLLSQHDLDAHFGELEKEAAVTFEIGDSVRVRPASTPTRWRRPHLRTPGYIFGRAGRIVSLEGLHENPEVSAYGVSGARQPLYRVAFACRDLWFGKESIVPPHADDEVVVEVFQHWLEASCVEPTAKRMRSADTGSDQVTGGDGSESQGRECGSDVPGNIGHGHDHEEHGRNLQAPESGGQVRGDEGHAHDHDHGLEGHAHGGHGPQGHGHDHDARAVVEQEAVDREGCPRPAQKLAECLVRALLEKGVLTSAEIRAMRSSRDALATSALGARVVAKAWREPTFRSRLLKDANAALREDFQMELPAKLVVVENTAVRHNVVVCTLCSCYPTRLLGRPPAWYKSREYRARVVLEPRAVLREFGTVLPESVSITVHDSTADLRYLVLPEPPAGDGGTEEELAKKVHRDQMVGVQR